MKKKLAKWFLKLFVTNKRIKEYVHSMNANFAKKVKAEGKEAVFSVANDVSGCIKLRIEGFADDGHIDEGELAKINANDDANIDKYFSDKQLAELFDRIFEE